MALVINDRVRETSTSQGTGTINLAGAVTGFRTFVDGIGDGNTTYYAIFEEGTNLFEIGLGTVTDATPDTLARTTVLSNSSGNTSKSKKTELSNDQMISKFTPASASNLFHSFF